MLNGINNINVFEPEWDAPKNMKNLLDLIRHESSIST